MSNIQDGNVGDGDNNNINGDDQLLLGKIDLEDLDTSLGGIQASDIDMDELLNELDFTSDGGGDGGVNSGGIVGIKNTVNTDGGNGLLDLSNDGDNEPPVDALLGRLSNHQQRDSLHDQSDLQYQQQQEQEPSPPELTSMEKLMTMDLIEVDEDKLRNELNEEIQIVNSQRMTNQTSTEGVRISQKPSLVQHQQDQILQRQQQEQQRLRLQQQQVQEQQAQYKQFATAASRSSQTMESNNFSSITEPAPVESLVQMGSDDLEREKIKLLLQLEEIKKKKQQNQLQQASLQQRSVNMSSATTTGQTPLQAFLNRSNDGGVAASVLSKNVPNAPGAATSILDVAPMDVGIGSSNPFLAQSRPSVNSQNASWGMDPSISNHRPGAGMRAYQDAYRQTGRASGMLPKHASEGVLMHASKSSLYKSKNRVGGVSRENALYDLLRNKRGSKSNLTSLSRQGSQKSLVRQGSQKGLVRQGSQKGLAREGSFGSGLFPVKRSSTGSSKHRIGGVGASMSVPHMRMGSTYNRSSSPSHQGNQQNAMW